MDKVSVKINDVQHYLWRAVDHEDEVLECFVSKRRNKKTALKFIKKAMKQNGLPKVITTDRLASYKATFRNIGIEDRQPTGCRLNNRCENSHLPFRRRERAMQDFKSMLTLHKFTHVQGQIYNHFNHEGISYPDKLANKNERPLFMSGLI